MLDDDLLRVLVRRAFFVIELHVFQAGKGGSRGEGEALGAGIGEERMAVDGENVGFPILKVVRFSQP